MANKYSPVSRSLCALVLGLVLSACGGSSGSDDFDVGLGSGVDNGLDPDVVNGFNLNDAQLQLEGPSVVGASSSSGYTATLLNSRNIPPVSPPGVSIELSVTAGSTNPPDGGRTDENGQLDFQFRAPNNRTEAVLRARVFNDNDELVLSRGITVNVLETLFQFTAPLNNTQIRQDEARQLNFNWRIGNRGATTGNENQGNPSAIRFSLAGRPAGGGFRLGDTGSPQDPIVVNVVNGELAQPVSVVAGDAGGQVNVLASATTDSQTLEATLPVIFVGQPSRIDATPSNIGVPAQGAQLLTVQVLDQNNTPLSDVPLGFSISICIDGQRNTTTCSGSGEQITRELRMTDSNGEATTGFIAGDGTGGGEIEISVQNGPGSGLSRAIVYNIGPGQSSSNPNNPGNGGSGQIATFSSPTDNTSIPVGANQQIVFNLRTNTAPLANEPVNFTITRGLIDDDPNTPPAPSNSRTITTDSSGNARFQIFSTEAGPATLNGGPAQLNLEFVPSLTSVMATAANASIAPGGANTITATALDSEGEPIEGIFLQFIIDAGGGTRSPASGITDDQGQITTTYTAGPNAGTVVIRVANQSQAISGRLEFLVASGP